jgi:uncharacterized repeat protein (TIGR02543 family)
MGAAVVLPTPSRTGHTFDGWYSDAGLTTRVGVGAASYSPTTNVSLYAKWVADRVVTPASGSSVVTSTSVPSVVTPTNVPSVVTPTTVPSVVTSPSVPSVVTSPSVPSVVTSPSVPSVVTPTSVETVSVKKLYVAKTLAENLGIKVVSSKAVVRVSVAKTSLKICTVVGAKLKTLTVGNCVVTFTVQEPTPANGKKPKASQTKKTLVVQ